MPVLDQIAPEYTRAGGTAQHTASDADGRVLVRIFHNTTCSWSNYLDGDSLVQVASSHCLEAADPITVCSTAIRLFNDDRFLLVAADGADEPAQPLPRSLRVGDVISIGENFYSLTDSLADPGIARIPRPSELTSVVELPDIR